MALRNRDRVGHAFELLATGLGADWEQATRDEVTRADANVLADLRDVRDRWARDETFSTDDTYRALDSIERLLVAVDAREADDVARGKFQLAEFAADLHQVSVGEGLSEYRDPVPFFERTFLTAGLRRLLGQAVERLTSQGATPIVDLQTGFGGGKTHSMIALYHLLSGTPATAFPQEVQELVREHGGELPGAHGVVVAAGVGRGKILDRPPPAVPTDRDRSSRRPRRDGARVR
ncbi:MAG: Swt1 family HEPN domain-containing protein [Actinomycetota bacterium]|nr:Swt1 family HEPN domain-containing protein [Actinomycetota bacterium]